MSNNCGIPDEKLIEMLNVKIDSELEKPEDTQDVSLIRECSAFIAQLDGGRYRLDKESKDNEIARLLDLYAQADKTEVAKHHIKRKIKWFPIAAALTLIICTFAVVTHAMGYDILSVLSNLGRDLWGLPANEEITVGSVTFVKHDVSRAYNSVQSLMESEGFSVIYPEGLPEGVFVEKVLLIEKEEGTVIMFLANDETISLSAQNYVSIDIHESDGHLLYEHNDRQYYIYESETNCDAVFSRTGGSIT